MSSRTSRRGRPCFRLSRRITDPTQREREVAESLANHGTAPTAAQALGCSVATIRTHVQNLSAKLANPLDLPPIALIVRWWLETGRNALPPQP